MENKSSDLQKKKGRTCIQQTLPEKKKTIKKFQDVDILKEKI